MRFVTWFHADSPEAPGRYAQVSGGAASRTHYEVYLRCVDACAATFRRWNVASELLVVLNPPAVQLIDRQRSAFWKRLGIDVRVIPNLHDDQLWNAWQNQFFLLDVMSEAVRDVASDEAVVVVDSDCVITQPLDELAERIRRVGMDYLEIPYPENHVVNGLTRRDLRFLASAYTSSEPPFAPAYMGGEYVAMTASRMRHAVQAANDFYAWNLKERENGRRHVNEEAQLLSIIGSAPSGTSLEPPVLGRIWTKPWAGRNVPPSVDELAIWHLPGEKTSGIRRLARKASRKDSWFWREQHGEWLRRVANMVGTSSYGAEKLSLDLLALAPRIPSALARRLGSRS